MSKDNSLALNLQPACHAGENALRLIEVSFPKAYNTRVNGRNNPGNGA